MTKKMNTKKFYNFMLAIITILNGYAFSFFRGFSLAMIFVSAFAVISTIIVLVKNEKIVLSPFVFFAFFSLLMSIIPLSSSSYVDISSVAYTALKLIIWSLFITCSSYLYFDFEYFFKYLKIVIVVTFLYLLIQYFAHYIIHLSLPCTFDFGIIKANYDVYIREYTSNSLIFRPGSLWTEPGYLGYFYNGFLAIILFSDRQLFTKRVYKSLFFIITVAGIIMSMSTGAIGVMSIILFYKFLNRKKHAPIKALISISIILVVGYCAIKFNWISIFSGISKSLDNSIYKLQHLDSVGRVGQSYDLISLLSPFNKIFGVGVGNEKILFQDEFNYMNGYTTLYIWNGGIGVFVWVALLLYLIIGKCRSQLQRMLVLIIGIIGFFSGIFFGAHSFLYFIVAISKIPNEHSFLRDKVRLNNGNNTLRIIQQCKQI